MRKTNVHSYFGLNIDHSKWLRSCFSLFFAVKKGNFATRFLTVRGSPASGLSSLCSWCFGGTSQCHPHEENPKDQGLDRCLMHFVRLHRFGLPVLSLIGSSGNRRAAVFPLLQWLPRFFQDRLMKNHMKHDVRRREPLGLTATLRGHEPSAESQVLAAAFGPLGGTGALCFRDGIMWWGLTSKTPSAKKTVHHDLASLVL